MTNAPVLEYDLPANRILWHARWLPPTTTTAGLLIGDVKVEHGPPELQEWKSERGGDCRLLFYRWRIPLIEGACYVRTVDHDPRHNRTLYATVRNGRLVDATLDEIADILDPAGADERAAHREMRPLYKEKRGRGAILTPGRTYQRSSGDFIFVTWARKHNYRYRRAHAHEIAAWHAQQQAEETISPTP